jgi:hypothetical protein
VAVYSSMHGRRGELSDAGVPSSIIAGRFFIVVCVRLGAKVGVSRDFNRGSGGCGRRRMSFGRSPSPVEPGNRDFDVGRT